MTIWPLAGASFAVNSVSPAPDSLGPVALVFIARRPYARPSWSVLARSRRTATALERTVEFQLYARKSRTICETLCDSMYTLLSVRPGG